MEHHLLKLRNPRGAARILATLVDGEVLPLPPLSNCWVVLAPDGAGLELHPDVLNRHDADFDKPFSGARRPPRVTFASTLPASRVMLLAQKAGWPSRRNGEFVEISVEGRHNVAILSGDAVSMMVEALVRRGADSGRIPDTA